MDTAKAKDLQQLCTWAHTHLEWNGFEQHISKNNSYKSQSTGSKSEDGEEISYCHYPIGRHIFPETPEDCCGEEKIFYERGKLQVTMRSSSTEVTMMESQNRKRAPAWTEREVRDLNAVWGEESMLSELRSSFRNAKTFVKISQGIKDRGHNRGPKQCCVKLKELRQAYQKTREANSHSGSEPKTCRFYDELHAILGGSATTTPAVLFDSFHESALTHAKISQPLGIVPDPQHYAVPPVSACFPGPESAFHRLSLPH
ncbi:Zinc finger and SCAN domain-containing protein 29 [Chelonia mydas]|uniref:Zinc finger and SCAN domain-containing protein 29 n=1 Tax=Chelonia mydas TaxID=8469 RepID=M7BER7_CHEMY|nr:Zinc finger and SCAN domain-containing protein 29 [Chelonia mydas]